MTCHVYQPASSTSGVLRNQTLADVETCYKMFTREALQTLRLTANDFGVEIHLGTQIALGARWRIPKLHPAIGVISRP